MTRSSPTSRALNSMTRRKMTRPLRFEACEDRRMLAVSILLSEDNVTENTAGAIIGALSVDGVSPSATKVTVNFDARIATVSNTPFGYTSEQAREQQVLGSFMYDLTKADINGTSSRGHYPHTGGGGAFTASFLNTTITGSGTPFVEIENFGGGVSDTFRFIDGPRTIGNQGGVMSVNGTPDNKVELGIAFTDTSGNAFSSDALPNPLPFAVPPLSEPSPFFFAHTFSIKDGTNGTLLLQLNSISMAADYTLSVSDDRFEIVEGQLKLKSGVSLNYEAEPTVSLEVTATAAGGEETTEQFLIQVGNVNEPPTGIALSRGTVFANIAGAWVATLTASDPDAGGGHTFAVDDDRFVIVGEQLFLRADQALDPALVPSVTLAITAFDSGGLSQETTFVLPVETLPNVWEFAHQWKPNPYDVNVDGVVSPLDAVLLINELNALGSRALPPAPGGTRAPLFFDVSGDNNLGPTDPILVINYINAGGTGGGEDEANAEAEEDGKLAALSPSVHDEALLAWLAWNVLASPQD